MYTFLFVFLLALTIWVFFFKARQKKDTTSFLRKARVFEKYFQKVPCKSTAEGGAHVEPLCIPVDFCFFCCCCIADGYHPRAARFAS